MKRVQIKYYQKLPPNTKNVSRASRWGNPFRLKQHGGSYTEKDSLYFYKLWLEEQLANNPAFLDPLKGFNLGCFCPLDQPCHADILLRYLEQEN